MVEINVAENLIAYNFSNGPEIQIATESFLENHQAWIHWQ